MSQKEILGRSQINIFWYIFSIYTLTQVYTFIVLFLSDANRQQQNILLIPEHLIEETTSRSIYQFNFLDFYCNRFNRFPFVTIIIIRYFLTTYKQQTNQKQQNKQKHTTNQCFTTDKSSTPGTCSKNLEVADGKNAT